MTTGSEDRHDRPTLPHRESVTDKEAVRVITGRPVSACKRCKGRKIKVCQFVRLPDFSAVRASIVY